MDATSQVDWATRVGSAVGRNNIIQAGNWLQSPPQWGAAQLIARETAAAKQYIRHYAHHNYPGGSIQKLQTHSQTASNVRSMFNADVAAVKRQTGKEYVLGETNSGRRLSSLPSHPLFLEIPHTPSLTLSTLPLSRKAKGEKKEADT